MDLEFEKYCKVDQSPRTVLPSSQQRTRKSKSSSRNNQLSLETGFKEVKLRNYHRSVSCKSLPTRTPELAVDREVLKRGSVYQSSKERKSFKRPDNIGGRKKIEFSLSDDTPFSFSLLDSICGSDEEEEEDSRKPTHEKLDNRERSCSKSAERDLMENSKFKSHEVVGPSSSANMLKEEDNQALQKSLSVKLALPHSPTDSESERSKGSAKPQFTPIRRMFDPLTKSRSHRSRLSSPLTKSRSHRSRLSSKLENKTLQKSLLHDFSAAIPYMESKDHHQIASPCSPAHLHGDLKLEDKHGVAYFELSLAHSENVLVARTWKAEDALKWVYTFHSGSSRKKSNASGWGTKFSNKDSPMVGQMQVSCHLCSELQDGGALSNSMMTEFVLYDIVDPIRLKTHAANAFELGSLDFPSPYPWGAEDLHPSHEVAAVVIQAPFEKRESMKHRSGDTFSPRVHPDMLDLSLAEQTPKGNSDSTGTRVNVVMPLGNHGLPTCESRGPSSLLDRWRLGGGCDCGGWDMACPLVVFDNLSTQCKEEHSILQSDQPVYLYVQGAKEKTPALSIRFKRKGHYLVDFHAQMSALQALGICLAILHTTEASTLADQEKHRQLLQCSSMKVFVEDEVKALIEAVTEEEKDKGKEKAIKVTEDHPPFMLNPPFSPIARV